MKAPPRRCFIRQDSFARDNEKSFMEEGNVEMGFNQGRLVRGTVQGVNKDRTVGSALLSWKTEVLGVKRCRRMGLWDDVWESDHEVPLENKDTTFEL